MYLIIKNISSRFSRDSEVDASELQGNFEDIFLVSNFYYINQPVYQALETLSLNMLYTNYHR